MSYAGYRPDIDGLRAVAVIAVVIYHAFPQTFGAGFVGVDIFFVISGYLISGNILQDLALKTFTFRGFYIRRIRRIFPSLIVVLIVCLAIGWVLSVLLIPYDVIGLGRQVIAAVAFLANFFLWQDAGYFDSDATTKPLLHLWSLGIEEQFYIVWPSLLWLAWKRELNILAVTVLIALASFAADIHNLKTDPVGTFYAPHTRIWELLIGAMLACVSYTKENPSWRFVRTEHANSLSILGAGLIALGFVSISNAKPFPSWLALLPVFGTALVIAAEQTAWLNRVILSNRAMIWVGVISYPLYLWHWPLLSFAHIVRGQRSPTVLMRLGIIAGAVLLAWTTYRTVEKAFRFGPRRDVLWKLAPALMLGVAAVAFVATSSFYGVQDDITDLLQVKAYQTGVRRIYEARACFRSHVEQTWDLFPQNGCLDIRYPNRPIIFLIGDSHSASLSLGLRPLLAISQTNLLQVSTGWCKPTSVEKDDDVCLRINAMVKEEIRAIKPDLLIIDEHWVQAAHELHLTSDTDFKPYIDEFAADLIRLGAKALLIIGQIPTWEDGGLPDHLIKEFSMRHLPIPTRTYNGVDRSSLAMDDVMKSIPLPAGAMYASVRDILCNDQGCLTKIGPDLANDLVVMDYGHLTPRGSEYVVERLFEDGTLGTAILSKAAGERTSR